MWAYKFYYIETEICGFYVLHRCGYQKTAESFEIILDFQCCKLEKNSRKKKMKALSL